MSCTSYRDRIDAYVDGELAAPLAGELRDHLESCADCRRAVEETRALLAAAAALPREIEPPRDLLPAIREAASSAGRRGEGPARAFRDWRLWAGAAASLLILLTATLVLLLPRGPQDRPAGAPVSGPDVPAAWSEEALLLDAEEEYARATRLLLATLEQRRGELSPETQEVVDSNLRVIDEAIEQVRLVLARDPGNPRNMQTLTALHRNKVQFLWRVSKLSS